MLVLAIDTSTPTVTAGLIGVPQPHEILARAQRQDAELPVAARSPGDLSFLAPVGDTVLAERSITDPFGHAEHLMPLVTEALALAGRRIDEIDAVVVGVGPGPFTGLRVGMATAAALGDALDVPVHGVPSHDAMALRAAHAGDFLVVTDARRREVYLSAYAESAARVHGPVVVAPADVPALLAAHRLAPEWITGAAAPLLADALSLPVCEPGRGLAGSLVAAAAQPLLTGAVPGPLVPLYLRRPDAAEPSGPKPVLGPADRFSARQGSPRPPAPQGSGQSRQGSGR